MILLEVTLRSGGSAFVVAANLLAAKNLTIDTIDDVIVEYNVIDGLEIVQDPGVYIKPKRT